jgi:hypothetical protein
VIIMTRDQVSCSWCDVNNIKMTHGIRDLVS